MLGPFDRGRGRLVANDNPKFENLNRFEFAALTSSSLSLSSGVLHSTLSKLNNAADKVPNVVRTVNDGIEVRIESIVHPQPDGMVRSTVRGATELAKSLTGQVTGFASNVGGAAANMTRNSAQAISASVRRSVRRLLGRKGKSSTTAAPALTNSSAAESSEPSEEDAAKAPELSQVVEVSTEAAGATA